MAKRQDDDLPNLKLGISPQNWFRPTNRTNWGPDKDCLGRHGKSRIFQGAFFKNFLKRHKKKWQSNRRNKGRHQHEIKQQPTWLRFLGRSPPRSDLRRFNQITAYGLWFDFLLLVVSDGDIHIFPVSIDQWSTYFLLITTQCSCDWRWRCCCWFNNFRTHSVFIPPFFNRRKWLN